MIAGLGNPGSRYAETRHNAGFWFLNGVAESTGAVFRSQSRLHAETARVTVHGVDCLLVRPTTFMNHSGQAIRAVMDYFRVAASQTLIAYDELDLPPGVARLKRGGGHGGHNGLRDLIAHLGAGFWRLRLGIGHPGNRAEVVDYVLKRPSREEGSLIRNAVAEAADVIPIMLGRGEQPAMHRLHTRAAPGKQAGDAEPQSPE